MVRWCWVNFQCRGVLLIWIRVGQGPTALAVGAGWGCLDILSLVYHFSFLSPSLWETARYRLKYCLKGPLSLKQPTNHLCAWRTNEVLAGESRLLQDYHLKFSNNIFICSNDESGSRHPWGWSGGAIWLVGCFGFNGPLRQYFSLYRAVSQREGERGERIDESKTVQTTPTRTYCKRNRPLPYCNQNCRTPRHWKFTQHHRTTQPPHGWSEGAG